MRDGSCKVVKIPWKINNFSQIWPKKRKFSRQTFDSINLRTRADERELIEHATVNYLHWTFVPSRTLNCFKNSPEKHRQAGRTGNEFQSLALAINSLVLLSLFAITYFDFWWELDKQMFIFLRSPSLRQSEEEACDVCVWIFYLISWFAMVHE